MNKKGREMKLEINLTQVLITLSIVCGVTFFLTQIVSCHTKEVEAGLESARIKTLAVQTYLDQGCERKAIAGATGAQWVCEKVNK